MGLAILILGLVVFIAAHLLIGFRATRAAAIARLGKAVYHSLFGLISIAGVALIAWGYATYRAGEWVQIWTPPNGLRHVTIGLMLIAAILIAAYAVPSHIKVWTKTPLITATKVWAFAHLLINGDLGSILMFGSLLAWAIYASINARQRKDAALPIAPAGLLNDVIVVLLGIALYLALGFWFHPYVIGVPVFGR